MSMIMLHTLIRTQYYTHLKTTTILIIQFSLSIWIYHLHRPIMQWMMFVLKMNTESLILVSLKILLELCLMTPIQIVFLVTRIPPILLSMVNSIPLLRYNLLSRYPHKSIAGLIQIQQIKLPFYGIFIALTIRNG